MAIIALDSTGPPTTLSEVINTAHAHDEIHIKGVVEVSDSITIRVPLVFVGHNGQATIVSRMPLRQGRGIFITECDTTIPCSRENPKILRVDDTEVVRDLIAINLPISGHAVA